MPMCPPPKMTAADTNNNNQLLKSVRFDQVFVHEFPIILGDNPAVSKGAPITIDWKPIAHDVVDLDIYEYLREPERRHRKRMIMSNSKRAKILMSSGYSIDDIAEMTLQVEEAKRVRAENALDSAALSNNAWFKNMNTNIMELLSGAAEGTGRTLFIAAPNAVLKGANKVGIEMVRGTGKVVVGTGKAVTAVGVGTGKIMATTGKVSADIAVGTVKGTGKVVVGAGKATTAVVVGTGKLGYDVVKNTGKRMSKFMNLNESASRDMTYDEHDLGYEDVSDVPDPRFDDPFMSRSSNSTTSRDRRGSNEPRDRRGSNETREIAFGRGTPAPQRMTRRGSANGSVAVQVATRTSNPQLNQLATATSPPSSQKGKAKRRGSGNSALAGSFSNFTNIFTGRGVRRANSSSAGGVDPKLNGARRTKSGESTGGGGKGDRRRRATLTAGGPTSPRLTKSANAATLGGAGGFSELAQMEQFLSFVRESEPTTVNPIIGNAYTNAGNRSDSSIEYDPSEEDDHNDFRDHHQPPQRSVGRSVSAPEKPLPPNSMTAEPAVTPVA